MPGGMIDDPDMRYGFAIDRIFSKRFREAKRQKCAECGAAIGIGQMAVRKYCNDCRAKKAREIAARNEREAVRRNANAVALARIRRDTRRQLRRAAGPMERIAAGLDGRTFEAPRPKRADAARPPRERKPRRAAPVPHAAPAAHPWRRGASNA